MTTSVTAPPEAAPVQKKETKHREIRAFNGLAHLALVAWALVTAGPLL